MLRKKATWRWTLKGVGGVALLGALGWWVLPWVAPLPPRLERPLPVSPVFLAADGTPLRQLLSVDGQRTLAPVSRMELPEKLVQATLAAEDKRFYSHGGVDLLAIGRAALDNLTSRRVVSGASTLSQQLVKVSADERAPRTFFIKIKEALQARRLEMTWDKDRILTEYLNRVSYGNLLTGCATASQGYFNKPLRDLSPAECAFLAALPQSPTRLNPFRNLPAVQKRQKHILERMAVLGWLTEEEGKLAGTERATLQRYTGGFAAPHAIELLKGGASLAADGKIHTTIQTALQQRMESIIAQRLGALTGKHVTHAAAVVLENETGRVIGLAGSRDFFAEDGGQLNGAWVPHSPGSALKPFTYLLALERGSTPATILADLPIEYATPTGIYRPENYNKKFYGPITLREALGNSLNIPAVRALQQLGGEKVLCEELKSLGISTLTEPPEHYGLGLTIGNAPVRLLELANAYACLARLGKWKEWTLLHATAQGSGDAAANRKHTEQVSFLIADILHDAQARMLAFGPHTVIRMPFPCAVKTGTSTSYRDNWTMGFTPEFTVGVWVGNFDNSPMNQVSGVAGAGPIFRDIMIHLHETQGTTWYAEPSGIVRARIDPRNGKRLDDASPSVRASREESFLTGTLPPAATARDYDSEGRALLPRDYTRWVHGGDHWLAGLVALQSEDSNNAPPRISIPVDGSVFQLDPDLKDKGGRLLLRATGPAGMKWSSPSIAIVDENGLAYATLVPGHHELRVEDPVTGAFSEVRIEVRDALSATEKLRVAP
ncbi:penicillin-binding protein 1C [Roseimicrobium gellanilyticum]|uniref:peptidoglycan glycosyltransferase n=2 Tax=Roseimicrobium gellanilyticum TaxID=748857 RepID=A0A366HRL0_9BACT|nr:penicillin-binding protein 1C [Roseimicrobium gellanilyticum]